MKAIKNYRPGNKPLTALAVLVVNHAIVREELTPFAKAGLTLLLKRGLVRLTGTGDYLPVWGSLAELAALRSWYCELGLVDAEDEPTQWACELAEDALAVNQPPPQKVLARRFW